MNRRGFLGALAVSAVAVAIPFRLVQSPPVSIYDPVAYGANGDGFSDSAEAIQSAINLAAQRGCSAVFIPKWMIPYDASKVTFRADIQMIRE